MNWRTWRKHRHRKKLHRTPQSQQLKLRMQKSKMQKLVMCRVCCFENPTGLLFCLYLISIFFFQMNLFDSTSQNINKWVIYITMTLIRHLLRMNKGTVQMKSYNLYASLHVLCHANFISDPLLATTLQRKKKKNISL